MVQMQVEKMYQIKEASEILGYKVSTLRRYIRDGKIEARFIGRSYQIPETEIIRIQSGKPKPTLKNANFAKNLVNMPEYEQTEEKEIVQISLKKSLFEQYRKRAEMAGKSLSGYIAETLEKVESKNKE